MKYSSCYTFPFVFKISFPDIYIGMVCSNYVQVIVINTSYHMNMVLIFCQTQNQTAWKWHVIFVLSNDFTIIDGSFYIVNSNAAFE